MTSTAPSPPTLKSLKHEDIIECILKSVEEKEYHGGGLDFDQKRWLLDVTNDGLDEHGDIDPNPVVDFHNTSQVNFALLNLSKAGKTLNARKWEEEGIDDFIGTHFPKFKNNPSYQPYPKNYNMNLQTEFNLPQSNADFLCQYWRPEHCDPNNWNAPSTFGIEGVILVDRDGNHLQEGDKSGLHMKMFTRSWDNPTRSGGTSLSRVKAYAEIIKTEGMGIQASDPIYFDYETDENVNGNGRFGAAEKCDIPGWMQQGVIFLTEEAKLLFAALSQPKNKKGIFGEELSRDDVCSTVKALCQATHGGETEWDEDYVAEMVERVGSHLSDSDKRSIKRELKKDFIANPNMNYGGVQSFDVGTHVTFLNRKEFGNDEWVENIFNDDEKYVQFVTTDQGKMTHSYSSLMKQNVEANTASEPLNLIVNLKPPTGKSSQNLDASRDEFFSKHIKRLEDLIIKSLGLPLDDLTRRRFAWNHPDCQHVALAQDRTVEKNKCVIPLKNRDFN